ncbi:hypothetical protein BGZ49_004118, partial [Haplosporangium sp. Z 27]
MAPLLNAINAKAWFKKRRSKKRANNNTTETYIPGIGYPPMRNSSQPTLIPYIPPTGSSSCSSSTFEHENGPDSSLETVTQEKMSAATTTCLGISSNSALLAAAAASSSGAGSGNTRVVMPGQTNDYHDDYCRRYQENNESSATLVPPFHDHRRISLQQPPKPFALAMSAQRQKNGSHSSLPAQALPSEILTDLKSCPQMGAGGSLQDSTTVPQRSLTNLKSSRFAASTDSLSESRAQEYARTVKTLWHMVEDKDLAHRLADCSPVEREWLIFNHKNANFPLKPTPPLSAQETTRTSLDGARGRNGIGSRGIILSRIDELEQYESITNMPHCDGCQMIENTDEYDECLTISLPNSPCSTGPIELPDPKNKRATKRDHITIQQRVDMEEDWRMQARLIRSQTKCEDRTRGVRRVHEQLLQRQRRQLDEVSAFPRYEPTHQDFNKWYDLKEEIDDNAVPDLNDDIRGFDLKEEFEDEEEKKQRELEEKEEKKELEDLEQELTFLGLDRFDGMISFVESDEARVPQQQQQQQQQQKQNPQQDRDQQIKVEVRPGDLTEYQQQQQLLHQQLSYQYQQLQLQLELQRQKTIRSKKNRAARGKRMAAANAANTLITLVDDNDYIMTSPALGP